MAWLLLGSFTGLIFVGHKVCTEKNETCVLYYSSKTIAAGAFSQANHQLYYLWAWKWGIVCLCKPKIVGNMSKNIKIGICENSLFCKKKLSE